MHLLLTHMFVKAQHYCPAAPASRSERVGQTCLGDCVGLCSRGYRHHRKLCNTLQILFLHMKHLFAVTLPPSQTQNPKDWGGRGIGMTAGSAAVGPLSGRQRHLAEEEEVIKQLELLRAAG